MKILVTGGAGFIGANFVLYWMREHPEDELVVYDKLTYAGHLSRLAPLSGNPRMRFAQGDIEDYQAALEALQGCELVVHFAAESHVDRSLSGLEAEKLFLRTNVEGTATMLHAARAAGVSRFHHISTDEVFGDLGYDTPEKFHERFPYNPHNPYSISKAAADFVVQSFARTHGLPVTLSNCTNNYGPLQTPEKMIPRALALLLQGEKIKLYTDAEGIPGRNIRDWLHVEDHCSAIEAILLRGRIGETYCIGGDGELSNYQLVERILAIVSELTGQPMSVQSHVELVRDRPGHDRRYAMDTSKIEAELGWRPRHTLESGLRSTIAWYLSQEGQQWLQELSATTSDVRLGQGARV